MQADGPDLRLLGDLHVLEAPKSRSAALGSLAVHALLLLAGFAIPWSAPAVIEVRSPLARSEPITLVAPPKLTQTAPSASEPAKQLTLEGLLAKRDVPPTPKTPAMTAPAAPRRFEAPSRPAPEAPKPTIEAPKIAIGPQEQGELLARNLPPVGVPNVPTPPVQPPQIQAEEKPKLAFQKPGAEIGTRNNTGAAQAKVPMPARSSIEDMMRNPSRGGGGGLTVGDIGEGVGGLGDAINNPTAPLRNGSSLELLSDPQGVDFKPYLIRILSMVRRNWLAVIPESARLGRRGKVQVQFAIDRSGSVPKLVIAWPSGTEALDRAAVAGVSASNPFPPLPDEFKGQQIRLQFTFLYNMAR